MYRSLNKYLSFVISNKRKYKEHIRKLSRKRRIAARKVWREYAEMILRESGHSLDTWCKM